MVDSQDWNFSSALTSENAQAPSPAGSEKSDDVTLIMLSGGLDSAASVVKFLTETDDHIIVHHINLINHLGRAPMELQASYAVVEYCKSHYRAFDFTTSTLDLSFMRHIVPDIYHTNYILGLMVSTDPRIKKLGKCLIADDYEDPTYNERREIAWDLYCSLAPSKTVPKSLYLLRDMTKSDILSYLPPDLVRLTWSCRTPLRQPNGFQRCGKCTPCKQILGALPTQHGVTKEWFEEVVERKPISES